MSLCFKPVRSPVESWCTESSVNSSLSFMKIRAVLVFLTAIFPEPTQYMVGLGKNRMTKFLTLEHYRAPFLNF